VAASDLHPIAPLSVDLVNAVAHCRIGGQRPVNNAAFAEAKALGLLAQDDVWRATEQGEGMLIALGLLNGKPQPERALTVCLWAQCEPYKRPQFVTAWSDGLDDCYPESAGELRVAAEREFAAFGDETDWEFWTTREHLDLPTAPEQKSEAQA
jgi:hypothetical protein